MRGSEGGSYPGDLLETFAPDSDSEKGSPATRPEPAQLELHLGSGEGGQGGLRDKGGPGRALARRLITGALGGFFVVIYHFLLSFIYVVF